MADLSLICAALFSMLLLVTHFLLSSANELSQVQMKALLDLKASTTSDPENCLSGLRNDKNPCSSPASPSRIHCDDSRTKVLNLDLKLCRIAGSLSPSIGKLTDLQSLYLDANYFSGAIPDAFSDMSSLSVLSMTYSGFSGPIPSSFAHLTSLQELFLNGNKLVGDVPIFLLHMPHLTTLSLFSNNLNKAQLPAWVVFHPQSS